jgi:hypothetical protein
MISEAIVAAVAHSSDKRSAVRTWLSASNSGSPRHGARTNSATSGSTRKASPIAAGARMNSGAPRRELSDLG